jgi:hypothetical protein
MERSTLRVAAHPAIPEDSGSYPYLLSGRPLRRTAEGLRGIFHFFHSAGSMGVFPDRKRSRCGMSSYPQKSSPLSVHRAKGEKRIEGMERRRMEGNAEKRGHAEDVSRHPAHSGGHLPGPDPSVGAE